MGFQLLIIPCIISYHLINPHTILFLGLREFWLTQPIYPLGCKSIFSFLFEGFLFTATGPNNNTSLFSLMLIPSIHPPVCLKNSGLFGFRPGRPAFRFRVRRSSGRRRSAPSRRSRRLRRGASRAAARWPSTARSRPARSACGGASPWASRSR